MPDRTVSSIWIFPIKSARGTQVESWGYNETGMDWDRHWVVVDEQTHTFLTARNVPRMVLISPTLSLADQTLSIHIPAYKDFPASTHIIPLAVPASSATSDRYHSDISIWDSPPLDGYEVGSPELIRALSDFMGKEVLLVQKGEDRREAGPAEGWIADLRKTGVELEYEDVSALAWQDQFPVLVVSEASLADVQSKVLEDESVRSKPGFDEKRWSKDAPGPPAGPAKAGARRGAKSVSDRFAHAIDEEIVQRGSVLRTPSRIRQAR